MIRHLSTSDIQKLVECIIKEIKNAEIIIKDKNITGPNSLEVCAANEIIFQESGYLNKAERFGWIFNQVIWLRHRFS